LNAKSPPLVTSTKTRWLKRRPNLTGHFVKLKLRTPKDPDWLEEARHRHALAVRFADAALNEKFAEARRRLLNADG
jgi:hypothetical protein